jgi:ribosomal protein L37AE/L43A
MGQATKLPPRKVSLELPDRGVRPSEINISVAASYCYFCRETTHRRAACPVAPSCRHCGQTSHGPMRCPANRARRTAPMPQKRARIAAHLPPAAPAAPAAPTVPSAPPAFAPVPRAPPAGLPPDAAASPGPSPAADASATTAASPLPVVVASASPRAALASSGPPAATSAFGTFSLPPRSPPALAMRSPPLIPTTWTKMTLCLRFSLPPPRTAPLMVLHPLANEESIPLPCCGQRPDPTRV